MEFVAVAIAAVLGWQVGTLGRKELKAIAIVVLGWTTVTTLASLPYVSVAGVLVGRGALRLPGARVKTVMAKAEARLEAKQGMENAIYCASAFLGIPPYYLVAVTSGMVHYPLPRFVALGLLGRFARFAILVSVPGLVEALHIR